MIMADKKYKSGSAFHLRKLSNYYTSPIVLEKDDRVSGSFAWAAIFAAVVAYDAYAIKTKKVETLTRAFWRNTEKPLNRIVPIVAWVGLTTHLLLEKDIRKKKFNNKN